MVGEPRAGTAGVSVPGSSFEFAAAPLRGSESTLRGRQDTSTVQVRIRPNDKVAQVFVGKECLASADRTALLRWLERAGSRPPYIEHNLRLRYSEMGTWFEVVGHTAPTMLVGSSVQKIIGVLRVP